MLNKMFDEFNNQYGLEEKRIDHDLSSMSQLIQDEVHELHAEIDCIHVVDIRAMIKEAIDTVYITCQQLRERGVDVDAALAEVHRSNMSKSVDGFDMAAAELQIASVRYPAATINQTSMDEVYVIKCLETGKVIKPTTYSPAVITDAMIGKE